jgi:2,3-diketo-5-methylthio-1-phosphopentane phosphatase
MQMTHSKLSVCVDFDGTITLQDSTKALLERFAGPAWRAVEDEWEAGLIGSAECLARQIDLLRLTPDEYDCFAHSIEIDLGFVDYVAFCRHHAVPVTVVSDGLDRTIAGVLARAGLDLKFSANRLEWRGGDRWSISFPGTKEGCGAFCANCKCEFVDSGAGKVSILIGDGRSDFCIARRSDLVLAKTSLLDYCREKKLRHIEFSDFADATARLAALLPRMARTGEAEPAG